MPSSAPQPLPASVLIEQKTCCGNGCRNCPYRSRNGQRHRKGETTLSPEWQRWILFDFDGTLADSLPLQLEAYQQLQQKYGFKPLTKEALAALRHLSLRHTIREQGIPLWRVPRLFSEGHDLLRKRWPEVQVFDGWNTTLPALKAAGFQLGIVTSNTRVVVELVLDKARLRPHFDLVIAERELWGKGKRLKKIVNERCWKPEHVWYVGDELRDIQAAQEASISSLAVSWGLNSAECLRAANVPLLDRPIDLVHWMQLHGKIAHTPEES